MDSKAETTMTEKYWGISIRRYIDDSTQLEEIVILPGGYSSVHLHEHKLNTFLVTSGELNVRIFKDVNTMQAVHIVSPGQSFCVKPGVLHQFYAQTEIHGYELYYASVGKLEADDIVRMSEGGLDEYVATGMIRFSSHDTDSGYCSICSQRFDPDNPGAAIILERAARLVCEACIDKHNLQAKTGGLVIG